VADDGKAMEAAIQAAVTAGVTEGIKGLTAQVTDLAAVVDEVATAAMINSPRLTAMKSRQAAQAAGTEIPAEEAVALTAAASGDKSAGAGADPAANGHSAASPYVEDLIGMMGGNRGNGNLSS